MYTGTLYHLTLTDLARKTKENLGSAGGTRAERIHHLRGRGRYSQSARFPPRHRLAFRLATLLYAQCDTRGCVSGGTHTRAHAGVRASSIRIAPEQETREKETRRRSGDVRSARYGMILDDVPDNDKGRRQR